MKAVFHIVEAEKWEEVISNVVDVITRHSDAKVEIVVMSKAAGIFGTYMGIDFSGILNNPQVNITIGEKCLNDHQLELSILPSNVKVEPSVICKIIDLENQGYAYIRL